MTRQHTRSWTPPGGRRAGRSFPDVVGRLREIDPRAELIYVGRGRWLLGAVWPRDRRRSKVAYKILANRFSHFGTYDPIEVGIARLYIEGFRPIDVYLEEELWDGRLVEDFRARDWRYRTRFDAELQERLAYTMGEPQLEEDIRLIREKIQAEKHDIEHIIFRKRHTVSGRVGRPRATI